MLTAITIAALGLAAALWVAGQAGMLTGKRPSNLGAPGGRLTPTPTTPNAVSSQASDPGHAVAPLAFTGDPTAAFARAVSAVRAMPGASIVVEAPGYLHAELTTRWLRFVDDLELSLDAPTSVIHVRSASRLGHSDLGANRARVEALRQRFAANS